MNAHQLRGIGILASLGVLAIVGCGEAKPLATPTQLRLTALAATYLDYAAARGAGPASEHELTRHLQSMPAFSLGLSDVSPESLRELFISPRDEQPFIIQYGKPVCLTTKGNRDVIAHESVGEDGTRYVAYADGQVECIECTSDDLKALGIAKGF